MPISNKGTVEIVHKELYDLLCLLVYLTAEGEFVQRRFILGVPLERQDQEINGFFIFAKVFILKCDACIDIIQFVALMDGFFVFGYCLFELSKLAVKAAFEYNRSKSDVSVTSVSFNSINAFASLPVWIKSCAFFKMRERCVRMLFQGLVDGTHGHLHFILDEKVINDLLKFINIEEHMFLFIQHFLIPPD